VPVKGFLSPLGSLTDAQLAAWRRLAAGAAEPNPFFEPEFVLACAEGLGPRRVSLAVVADGEDWVACLPIQATGRWGRLPARWRVTWRHTYCFLGTPLVDADRLRPGIEALVELLRAPGADICALEWIGADGPIFAALQSSLVARGIRSLEYERFERAALRRRVEPTYLQESLRPKRRKELTRIGRRLEKEIGPVEIEDLGGAPEAYEEFLTLEASGWKGGGGTALASKPEHAELFRRVCTAFAQSGRLQLLALRAGGRTGAMQCNLRSGDTFFSFKVAHDEELARHSPGVLLELRSIEGFHTATDAAMTDSCADPDNQLINRLWPDRISLATLVVPGCGPAHGAAMLGVRALSRLGSLRRGVKAARAAGGRPLSVSVGA